MFRCMKPVFGAVLISLVSTVPAHPRDFTLVTYNVENLFDADKVAIFEDYTESGDPGAYSPAKMLRKMEGIAKVLKTFNSGSGPDIVCLNELEMDFTPESKVTDYAAFLEKYRGTTAEAMLTTDLNEEVRGLPAEALLLKHLTDEGMTGYNVAVAADKPDFTALTTNHRGVHRKAHRNGLFSKFPVMSVRSHPTWGARDILEVRLDIGGHPLTVFVNHWKSGAGSLESEHTRRLNAKTLRDRLDEITGADSSADIIITGDFNSHYNQSSVYPHMGQTGINHVLGSQGDETTTATGMSYSLYNLWHELPADRRGSDAYKGKWGTLMQTMITPGLYDCNGVQYVDNSFAVAAIEGVNKTRHLGLPRRWSNFGNGSGFSDHFPVSLHCRIVEDGDKMKRLDLLNPGKPSTARQQRAVRFNQIDAKHLPTFGTQTASQPEQSLDQVFRVKGEISKRRPLTIKAAGHEYALWTSDKNFDALRPLRELAAGSKVEIVGLLTVYKGKPQFLVEAPSWILKH